MIFLSEGTLGPAALVEKWLRSGAEDESKPGRRLDAWMHGCLLKALDWAFDNPQAVEATQVGVVENVLSHLEGVQTKQDFANGLGKGLAANADAERRKLLLEHLARLTSQSIEINSPALRDPDSSSSGDCDAVLTEGVLRTLSMVTPWLETGTPFLMLITYKGFYDTSLEFVSLQSIQIVASMMDPNSLGRSAVSKRLTSIMRIGYMAYPTRQELKQIYSEMLSGVFKDLAAEDASWQQGLHSSAAICSLMIDVYFGVLKRFSVEECRHYVFTPRMLTQWVNGLRRYGLHGSAGPLDVVYHEGCRIFRDRLVGCEALTDFDRLILPPLKALGFAGDPGGFFWTSLGLSAQPQLQTSERRSQLSRWSSGDLNELFQEKIKSYEREHNPLNMILLEEVVERISRFDSCLSLPGGSMLLTGPNGVGRRTCVKLVAYMHHMEVFSPQLTRGYGIRNFREDLKELLIRAGIEGQPVCLVLEDHQIVDASMLECVNSIISGGEVPGLMTNEELEKALEPLKGQMAEEGFHHTKVFSFFASRVKRNLHVVLSLDPNGEGYCRRLESNPSLVSRCFIQCLEHWSPDGMVHLAKALLQNNGGCGDAADDLKNVHQTMTDRGATPRQFVSLVNLFKAIFLTKQENLTEQKRFLEGGLGKLSEAEKTVDDLSKGAEERRSLLVAKQCEAEDALHKITSSMEQAAERKQEVENIQKKLAVEEMELSQKRGGVEEELTAVQPLIDQARKAVGQIKPDNINEIRSLKMPPEGIRDVLEGVLLLMGQKDTSWNNMRKFLANKSVKDQIINYDARKITHPMRSKVEKLLQSKAASFEHANIYHVSVAAAPMASWVKANLEFSKVLENVAPLEDKLQGLTASLKASQDRLITCEEDLAALDQQEWSKVLRTDDFNFLRFMSTESERLTWKLEGLPGDNLSVENAVAVLHSNVVPLMVDPTNTPQAIKWLESHVRHENKAVEVCSTQSERFGTSLELAIRFGKTLIAQDVSSIEPLMYPLLRGDLETRGHRSVVRVGDKLVDYNESFRLFMVSRDPTPRLAPSARSLVALTTFTITREGLEGQLLSLTIQHEQPGLERQRTELLRQEEELKIQLAALEKQLLHALATSEGNVLENKDLLESLNETKAKSLTIQDGLTKSAEVHRSLDEQRNLYRHVAERGSQMFLAVKDLSAINHMYRFSLPWFLSIFRKALHTSGPSADVPSRVSLLSNTLIEGHPP
ncbi:unnamed protein product [Ostreobium quekettii]|uniref:Cytoplasmic dynein 2 heavy chain 1 n=1 Tax=Ostreobium quekettii TaxID=121088 RepID=A0A8S1IS21_9CHLO|nr:unnamed protein product [Ostreobium quekettii]